MRSVPAAPIDRRDWPPDPPPEAGWECLPGAWHVRDAEALALEECERRRNRDEDPFDTGESDGK